MPGHDPAALARMSDDELRALEKDGSISAESWQAVVEELRRRQRAGGARPAATATPPAGATPGYTPASARPAIGADEDPRVAAALAQLREMLVPGETLEAYAVQRRLFALVHRRQIVAATSGRFIAITRGLFGGYTPADVRWQDVSDAQLRVGIFGATLGLAALSRQDLASNESIAGRILVPGLRKEQAAGVYRTCQAQEQSWREKRRVRDLDEMRARAGGVQIGAMPGGGGPGNGAEDPMARLQRAKQMHDGGLISDAEFESIKARIVDRL